MEMNKVLKYSKVILFTGITVVPALVGAVSGPPSGPPTSGVPTDINGVLCLVNNIFAYLFYALILATIFFVIMAAFDYLASAGDPEKVKVANKQLLYAAIAIVVGILAKVFPGIVASILFPGAGLATC
jgi:hypothetical protein